MRARFFYYLNHVLHQLAQMEKKKLCAHAALLVLSAFSVFCFAYSVRTFLIEKNGTQDRTRFVAKAGGKGFSPEIAAIEKKETLLSLSYERAREKLLRSSGADPFLHALSSEESEPEAIYEMPPSLKVRGLFVGGVKAYVAVDVNGAEIAGLLSVGSGFDEGRGKIVAIDQGGVSWRWAGKVYKTIL